MQPLIAFLICLVVVIMLFISDIKLKPNVSSSLWVPLLWMLIIGSRPLSYWLNIYSSDIFEGSIFDAIVFFLFSIVGICIINKRDIQFITACDNNKWLFIFIMYGAISVFWSEMPSVTIKRFIKSLGNPIMAMVILSENDPMESIKIIFRRTAYVLLPFSFLCIKYFPQTGRDYSQSGEIMFRGVTGQKNELGLICFIFCVIFIWYISNRHRNDSSINIKKDMYLNLLSLIMAFALLIKSNSATSFACFIVGLCIILGMKLYLRDIKKFEFISLIVLFGYIFLDYYMDIKDIIIASLGRDSTLTSRVSIWEMLRDVKTNPIIGSGFESFWTRERMEFADRIVGTHSAHNGYLDIYLNLGIIGLMLFGMLIISSYIKIRKNYNIADYNRLKLTLIILILLYGYTEAYYAGLNLLYLSFYLSIIVLPDVEGENIGNNSNSYPDGDNESLPVENTFGCLEK